MVPYGKIALAFLLAAPAMAQQWVGMHAGMISYAEGIFSINDELMQSPDARFREIPEGASLRTGNSWVEVQLGPNAFLWMGAKGSLRMENSSLTNIQLLVEQGSVVIYVFEQIKGNRIRIRFGEAVIEPKQAGFYRLDSGTCQFRVYVGKAAVQRAGHKTTVKRGKAALFAGKLKVSRFDVQQMDGLQSLAVQRSQLMYRQILDARIQESLATNKPMQAQQRPWPQQQPSPQWSIENEKRHTGAFEGHDGAYERMIQDGAAKAGVTLPPTN
jgi:hypothetical protein